jgi:hypothetical protein
LERGFVDALIDRFVASPFQALAARLDRLDRWLCGPEERRESRTEWRA